MERSDILELMAKLKLFGMRRLRRGNSHRDQAPVRAGAHHRRAARPEIAEKQARSIKYQMTIAKLPLAKDLDGFTCDETRGVPLHSGGPCPGPIPPYPKPPQQAIHTTRRDDPSSCA